MAEESKQRRAKHTKIQNLVKCPRCRGQGRVSKDKASFVELCKEIVAASRLQVMSEGAGVRHEVVITYGHFKALAEIVKGANHARS